LREVTTFPDLEWNIPLPDHFQEIWRGWVTERVAIEISRRQNLSIMSSMNSAIEISRKQSSNIVSSMKNDDIKVCKKELCENLDLNARRVLALQLLRKHSVPGIDSHIMRQSRRPIESNHCDSSKTMDRMNLREQNSGVNQSDLDLIVECIREDMMAEILEVEDVLEPRERMADIEEASDSALDNPEEIAGKNFGTWLLSDNQTNQANQTNQPNQTD
jgi:molybdopterin-binding protein